MTFEETLQGMLEGCGMFDNHAAEVIERVKADPVNVAMVGRWQDDADGYSDMIFTMMWQSAKEHALAWIDENKPMAWYRPMFIDGGN